MAAGRHSYLMKDSQRATVADRARRCLAQLLLMRRESIAQSLPEARAAEVAAPSAPFRLILPRWF
jgi:hypothetical protein